MNLKSTLSAAPRMEAAVDMEGTATQGEMDLEVDQAAMEGTVAQGEMDLEVDRAAMEGTVAQG
jgi:hypothetical protein